MLEEIRCFATLQVEELKEIKESLAQNSRALQEFVGKFETELTELRKQIDLGREGLKFKMKDDERVRLQNENIERKLDQLKASGLAKEMDLPVGIQESNIVHALVTSSESENVRKLLHTILTYKDEENEMIDCPVPEQPIRERAAFLPKEADNRIISILRDGHISGDLTQSAHNRKIFYELRAIVQEYQLNEVTTLNLLQRTVTGWLYELVNNLKANDVHCKDIWFLLQRHTIKRITNVEAEIQLHNLIFKPKGKLNENVIQIFNLSCNAVKEPDKERKVEKVTEKAKLSLQLLLKHCIEEEDLKDIQKDVELHLRTRNRPMTYWELSAVVLHHQRPDKKLMKIGEDQNVLSQDEMSFESTDSDSGIENRCEDQHNKTRKQRRRHGGRRARNRVNRNYMHTWQSQYHSNTGYGPYNPVPQIAMTTHQGYSALPHMTGMYNQGQYFQSRHTSDYDYSTSSGQEQLYDGEQQKPMITHNFASISQMDYFSFLRNNTKYHTRSSIDSFENANENNKLIQRRNLQKNIARAGYESD